MSAASLSVERSTLQRPYTPFLCFQLRTACQLVIKLLISFSSPESDPCTISGLPPPLPENLPFSSLHRGRTSSVLLPMT